MPSQVYSQSVIQPYSSREFSGEIKPNVATSQASLLGFSAEQTSSIYQLIQAVFDQPVGPLQQPVQQPNPTPTSPPTQSISPAKKKRNQKSRNQRKKKAQAQHITIQVQEVEHSDVQISVEKASKHVVLQLWDYVATSWHAVIPWSGMALFSGMIMVQNGAIWRPRMGVG